MNKLVAAAKAAMAVLRSKPQNLSSDLKNPSDWMLDGTLLGTIASAAGITVTPAKAMGVSTVYACVNVVSRGFASLPVKLYRRQEDGSKVEIVDDRRSMMMRVEPNKEMTPFDLSMACQANLTLRNNAYAQILRDHLDRPLELIPIPNDDVLDIRRNSETKKIEYILSDGRAMPQKKILHLKGMSFTGYVGSDLTSMAKDSIGLAIALEQSASSFFKNGQRPGLIGKHPGSLSDQAYTRLLKELKEEHGGADQSWKFLLLEEGLDLVQNRHSQRESQFSESRKDQALEIARYFGVPPHKVGIESNLPRANVEEQNIEFVTDVLGANVVLWEQQLNKWLLTDLEKVQGYFFEYNLDAVQRGNIQSRYEAYSKARQWGWMSVNDIRKRENQNPIENGDIYLEPQNMIEAGKAEPKDTFQ